MSCTGIPSVTTTMSRVPASAASYTASAANRAGTRISDASAPVSLTASATVSKTGIPSTDWPAFPGVTPATTRVPYALLRSEWKAPSFPVMPCTTTRVDSSMRMDIRSGHPLCGGGPGQLHGQTRRLQHRWSGDDPRMRSLLQDLPPLVGVRALQPHHDGHSGIHPGQRLEDALSHQLPPGDAPEDVDEDGADGRVGEDHLQRGCHAVGAGPASDVQEVGGAAARL